MKNRKIKTIQAYASSGVVTSLKHYWIYGVILFAGFAAWVVVGQTEHFMQAVKNYKGYASAKGEQIFSINKTPVDKGEYEKLVTQLRHLNPSVEFVVNSTGALDIDSPSVEAFPEWAYAVNSLYSMKAGWLWSASEICMGDGKCPKPLHIRIKAMVQEVKINAE